MIDISIAIYIAILIVQILLSIVKYKLLGFIPIIVSLLIFLFSRNDDYYSLTIAQILIFVFCYGVSAIIQAIIRKKRNNQIDKMKIKDL